MVNYSDSDDISNNNDNKNGQYNSENIVSCFEFFSYISLDSDGQNKY